MHLNRVRSNLRSIFRLLVIAIIGTVIAACSEQKASNDTQTWVFAGPIMGTDYRITVVPDEGLKETQLSEKAVSAMHTVNEAMSHYLDDSEISRFNRLDAGQPMLLSDDFRRVMAESLYLYKLSDRYFDVTLSPAIDLWGFGPQGQITRTPGDDVLRQAKRRVGSWRLDLQANRLSKKVAGVELNLSAIAKGYAVDKVAQVLDSEGVANYLINIGGELRAKGHNSKGDIWTVGIEKPDILGGVQETVKLENAAIATSGDYRNFVEVDGTRFTHTIDPNTLKPVLHRLASVSVISERTSTADGLATAIMAMGPERGIEFAKHHDLAVFMLIRSESGTELSAFTSVKFERFLQ